MRMAAVFITALAALAAGCAPQRPVLYPNARLARVGRQAAAADIDDCLRMAEAHRAGGDAGARVAQRTAKGAVVGGAVGAAVGAVTGNLGRGTAAGAAAGAAGAAAGGILDARRPDPVTRAFVERCLREKGYAPIGWR